RSTDIVTFIAERPSYSGTSTDTLTVSPVSDMTFSVTVESAGARKISDRVHTGRWSRLGSSISARKSSTKPSPMSLIEWGPMRSEEHTSELQSRFDLVCRLLLEKKKQKTK